MGPELLIPILAPMITEAVKALLKALFGDVHPAVPPLLSAVAGGALGAVPAMESTIIEGLELGLAGVGIHQGARAVGLTKRKKRERATDASVAPSAVLRRAWLLPLLTLGMLTAACVNTKEASRLLVHGAIDGVCTVSHRAVDTAYGPVEDIQRDVNLTIYYMTGEKPAK